MEGAFAGSILNDPNWPNLLKQLDALPTTSNLVQFIREAQTTDPTEQQIQRIATILEGRACGE
jgi:hypothetical protein